MNALVDPTNSALRAPQAMPPIDLPTFKQTGYLIFESLLSEAECTELKAEIDQLVPRRINVACELPAHAALVTHPKLMGIARTLMDGTEYGFHHLHSACHHAGTPAFPWHHDYEQNPQVDRQHTMVHFFMYLNGLNGTVGDLLIIPGSHHQVLGRYDFSQLGTVDLPGTLVIDNIPPGSVVAIHSAAVHARRARPGGEGHPRYFIDASYCQTGRTWPAYSERGNWREILARLRARDAQRGGDYEFVFQEKHFG